VRCIKKCGAVDGGAACGPCIRCAIIRIETVELPPLQNLPTKNPQGENTSVAVFLDEV
jgi:hypothetical protein